MRIFVLFFILTVAASAQAVRDSTYTVDSTASSITVSVPLSAKQAAALYRCLGASWQTSLKDILVSFTRTNDPWRDYKEQYDAIGALAGFTNAQKAAIATGLGIPDPKTVRVQKAVAVPITGVGGQ